jgi:hypothetical protein
MRGRKANIINGICQYCGTEYTYKDTKRNDNREYCSISCAAKANGEHNKGHNHTAEWKAMMSARNSGENNPFYGRSHSDLTLQVLSKKAKSRYKTQQDHPLYKNGTKTRPDGYVRYSSNDKFVHRVVMEIFLGRELDTDEVVHHLNGDVKDNRIENLQLMTNSEHRKLHCKTQKRTENGNFAK